MGFFAKIRERQSRFYNRMWQELEDIPVIDTHEHFDPIELFIENNRLSKEHGYTMSIPVIFSQSYIHLDAPANDYDALAQELRMYRGTGYLTAWEIALDELYGIEPPITPKYLEKVHEAMNEAYAEDLEKKTYKHTTNILQRMNVKHVINNGPYQALDFKAVNKLPGDIIKWAAGLPDALEGMVVPAEHVQNPKIVYNFAKTRLGMNYADIITLDDYLDVLDKLLEYLKTQGCFVAYKFQNAYSRPISFPEPPEDDSIIARLFNKIPENEQEEWLFGNYIFHHILEWAAFEWNIPVQIHTGLARMYDNASDASNLSHVLRKFPDMHFDLFHGNYPYDKLAGMMHQIGNISADLCWLPAISPTAAKETLIHIFEVGTMVGGRPDRLPSYRTNLFGGDSKLVEGSYGALQLAKDSLIRALEDLVQRGMIMEMDAPDLAKRVLYENPKRIFNL